MSARRPTKRHRATVEGGSCHNLVSFGIDNFVDIHAREEHSRKVGSNDFRPATRTIHKPDEHWRKATSWAPLDDPNFALDPSDEWYNEAVEAPVMHVPEPGAAVAQKRKRSKASVSMHSTLLVQT